MFSRAQLDAGGNAVRQQGPGDSVLDQTQVFPITTAGAGVLTAAALTSGVIERTGPGGAFNDTLETADNLLAAVPQLTQGDSWEITYRNTVAFAETTVAAEGAELAGANTAVAASAVRRFLVTILAAGRRSIAAVAQTNASAVLTGLTQTQCFAIQPGMGATGTNIPASTTVIAVNSVAGTVTLSANATATIAMNAVTFFPRYNIRGLSSATL